MAGRGAVGPLKAPSVHNLLPNISMYMVTSNRSGNYTLTYFNNIDVSVIIKLYDSLAFVQLSSSTKTV